jgi:hypothetical protein
MTVRRFVRRIWPLAVDGGTQAPWLQWQGQTHETHRDEEATAVTGLVITLAKLRYATGLDIL